jgi:hypothetical protein
MDNLKNLPKFYIGQKVVCILEMKEDFEPVEIEKGCKSPLLNEIYTVRRIRYFGNDFYGIYLNEIINPIFEYEEGLDEAAFCEDNFIAVLESPFPSLTMSKVIEKESQLISMN